MQTAPLEVTDDLPSAATACPVDLAVTPGPPPVWNIAAGVAGVGLSAAAVAWMFGSDLAPYMGLISAALLALSTFMLRRDGAALRLGFATASTIAAAIPIALVLGMNELRRILIIDLAFVPIAAVTTVAYLRARRWVDDDANLLRRVFGELVGEWHGVQFVLLYPRGKIEAATKVWAVVQNATDAERSLELYLEEWTGLFSGHASLVLPEPATFELQPGECGVLVADVGVAPNAKEQAQLHAALYVDRLGKPGTRLLRWHAPTVIPRSLAQARRAEPNKLFGLLALYGGRTVSIAPAADPAAESTDPHVRMYPMTPQELASEFGLGRLDVARWG